MGERARHMAAKKEVQVKKPGPMKVADPSAKVWIPGIGEITVSELTKTAKERKAEAKVKFVPEELMKQWLTELSNLEYVPGMKGTFTSAMYKDLSNKLKEKLGRKVGVSKGTLKRSGYIDRVKVPGYKPFYFLTPKARDILGVPAPETPVTAAEKALEALEALKK